MRLYGCATLHQDFASSVGKGWLTAGAIEIQTPIAKLCICHVRGCRYQISHIDLAATAEDDAVAVDQHHRAVRFDLPLNLAGPCARIVDAIEHRPVGLLGKFHCGIAADVERFPIENRLVGGLLDLHRGLAVGLGLLRAFGVHPALAQAVIDLQAALAQSVRNHLHTAQCGGTSSGLCGLLSGNRCHGVIERLQRALQLLAGPLLLCQRWGHPRQTAPTRTRRRSLLRCALRGKPGGTERCCRLGTARHQTQGDGLRQWLEQPLCGIARATFDRPDTVTVTGGASKHHYRSFWVAGRISPAVTT